MWKIVIENCENIGEITIDQFVTSQAAFGVAFIVAVEAEWGAIFGCEFFSRQTRVAIGASETLVMPWFVAVHHPSACDRLEETGNY